MSRKYSNGHRLVLATGSVPPDRSHRLGCSTFFAMPHSIQRSSTKGKENERSSLRLSNFPGSHHGRPWGKGVYAVDYEQHHLAKDREMECLF